MKKMVEFYNSQVSNFVTQKSKNPNLGAESFIETDPKKISWSSSLLPNLERGNHAKLKKIK